MLDGFTANSKNLFIIGFFARLDETETPGFPRIY
jgi:hypothetical protein